MARLRKRQVVERCFSFQSAAWCRQWSPLRVGLVVATLVFVVRPAGASVETLPDGQKMLVAPWNDDDHTEACPNPDPRICPVLQLNNPAVMIRSQQDFVVLRDVTTLNQEEEDRGAGTTFFIYDYKYLDSIRAKRYTIYSGIETIEVTFTSTMGRTWYDVAEAQSCGVITDKDTELALLRDATLETGAQSFSVTATMSQINCFMGSIRFSKTGGRISSDMQLARFGAMSTMSIFIRAAENTANFRSAYKVATVIFYESIMFQPLILDCPAFSYPYPNSEQLPDTGS